MQTCIQDGHFIFFIIKMYRPDIDVLHLICHVVYCHKELFFYRDSPCAIKLKESACDVVSPLFLLNWVRLISADFDFYIAHVLSWWVLTHHAVSEEDEDASHPDTIARKLIFKLNVACCVCLLINCSNRAFEVVGVCSRLWIFNRLTIRCPVIKL